MNPAVIIKIIVLILLIAISAFFSASETALTTVNQVRMRTLADQGNRRAARVLKVTEKSHKMLSAILIGNNVANLSASSLSTSLTIQLLGNKGVGIATGILTVAILIFGEISPKTMATLRAERISMRFCSIIYVLMTILTPVIFVINAMAGGVLRLMGVDPSAQKKSITEQEIRTIMDIGHEEGAIETEEKEMINNLFDFGDDVAREIMIPRIDISFIQADASYDEVLSLYKKEKYTRYPIYESSTDDVIGILNVKDMLLSDRDSFHLRSIMRQPYFTYETKNLSELFFEMKSASSAMAIVLDEYGVTAGLITLEDLLEEIVGEIHDEYDSEEEEPVHRINSRELLVDASMNLEDFNDVTGLSLKSDDYDSLGGYLIGLTDHIPKLYENFTTKDGVYLRVQSKDKNRLKKIYVRLPGPEKKETDLDDTPEK